MSKQKTFRVEGLPSVWHTEETLLLWESLREEGISLSKYLRDAILALAARYSFSITNAAIHNVVKLTEIREFEKRSREVDYTYLYAFEFLKSHPEFRYARQSDIQRLALKEFGTLEVQLPT